jgi:chromosome partitioning protein
LGVLGEDLKTIALFNHKGGVGKTTSAVNLAWFAAKAGYRTLVWDLDAQGSASFYLGARPKNVPVINHLLKSKRASQNICATRYPRLSVIAADLSLRFLNDELSHSKNPKRKIVRVLDQLAPRFDLAILDVPPGLSALSDAVLKASDLLVSPMIPSPLSMRAYGQVQAYFKHEGFDLRKTAPFFTMVDRRKKLHCKTIEDYFAQSNTFLRQCIPSAAAIEKMGVLQAPVASFAPASVGGLAYLKLWTELRHRIDMPRQNPHFATANASVVQARA